MQDWCGGVVCCGRVISIDRRALDCALTSSAVVEKAQRTGPVAITIRDIRELRKLLTTSAPHVTPLNVHAIYHFENIYMILNNFQNARA